MYILPVNKKIYLETNTLITLHPFLSNLSSIKEQSCHSQQDQTR